MPAAMILPETMAAFPAHTFLVATASLTFLTLLIGGVLSYHRSSLPKGLRRPPSPPGARLFSGHSHLWSGNATSRPNQSQLVKWAEEYGEIYEIQLGAERWVVLSSPEAVRVSEAPGKTWSLECLSTSLTGPNFCTGGF